MQFLPARLRGPALMVLATGAYVINDSLMKLATVGLPPLEVLFLRGVCAAIWCLPTVILLGYGKDIPKVLDRWVLLRNGVELLAVVGFIIALANMPIADVTALGQVTPLLFIVGVSLIMREKIGGVRMALIGLGFIGAILVAQPSMQGINVYALFALSNAVFCAARDIAGRKVGAEVPGWIVSFSAILVVMIGAGIVSLFIEQWVMPQAHHMALLFGAGFFLMFGHFCLFTAYRVGEAGSVAPFYYMFTVWAVISGVVIFGTVPNAMAIFGMLFILASGLSIVVMDSRRKLVPAT